MAKVHKEKVRVWIYPGENSTWYFAGLNKKYSQKLRVDFKDLRRGFGSLPVEATVGKTTWNTSVFYDSRSEMYILPLKAEVRKKENIRDKEEIDLKLVICP